IGDNFRRLCGSRALTARGILDTFDLAGNLSKAEQELSKALTLGIIAARTVRDFVRERGHLPDPGATGDPAALTARVVLTLALPINEYVRHRESYKAQFMGAARPHHHSAGTGDTIAGAGTAQAGVAGADGTA